MGKKALFDIDSTTTHPIQMAAEPNFIYFKTSHQQLG